MSSSSTTMTGGGSSKNASGGGVTQSSSVRSSSSSKRYLIAITTSHPSSSITTSGGGGAGGGSLIIIDGKSFAILSSLRTSGDNNSNSSGGGGLGLSSLSPFPSQFVNTAISSATGGGGGGTGSGSAVLVPAITFGGTTTKRGDTYASLISIRCGGSASSSPPIINWKCRLPEPDMYQAGLVVSPCGHYVVGGGSSGSCYVWSTTSGRLIRTFQAHYRAVTALCFSGPNRNSGQYLITGGADGMIHVFSMMDLVVSSIDGGGGGTTRTGGSDSRTVPSLYTFSIHHFPITTLESLDGGRVASASEDGQVVILEVFSEQVLLNIQLPHGVACLAYHADGRLFAGSNRGTIYSIDMNAYTVQQTQKQCAMISKRRQQEWQRTGVNSNNATLDEMVFGVTSKSNDQQGGNKNTSRSTGDDTTVSYQTDWIGHNDPVTSLELLTQSEPQILISGDSSGQVRIWGLESRTCLKVLQPWSHSSTTNNSSATSTVPGKKHVKGHPVTSIQIIPQPDELSLTRSSNTIFGSSSTGGNKNYGSVSSLLPQLQKYAISMNNVTMDETTRDLFTPTAVRIPYLKPNDAIENASYWTARPITRRRKRQQSSSQRVQQQQRLANIQKDDEQDEEGSHGEKSNDDLKKQEEIDAMREEMEALRSQLKEKESTIERWEAVNNKLMQRLKAKK
jgi:WD domain, G-beta repeat